MILPLACHVGESARYSAIMESAPRWTLWPTLLVIVLFVLVLTAPWAMITRDDAISAFSDPALQSAFWRDDAHIDS